MRFLSLLIVAVLASASAAPLTIASHGSPGEPAFTTTFYGFSLPQDYRGPAAVSIVLDYGASNTCFASYEIGGDLPDAGAGAVVRSTQQGTIAVANDHADHVHLAGSAVHEGSADLDVTEDAFVFGFVAFSERSGLDVITFVGSTLRYVDQPIDGGDEGPGHLRGGPLSFSLFCFQPFEVHGIDAGTEVVTFTDETLGGIGATSGHGASAQIDDRVIGAQYGASAHAADSAALQVTNPHGRVFASIVNTPLLDIDEGTLAGTTIAPAAGIARFEASGFTDVVPLDGGHQDLGYGGGPGSFSFSISGALLGTQTRVVGYIIGLENIHGVDELANVFAA